MEVNTNATTGAIHECNSPEIEANANATTSAINQCNNPELAKTLCSIDLGAKFVQVYSPYPWLLIVAIIFVMNVLIG